MATIRKRGERWQVQVRRVGAPTQTKSFINRKDAEAWSRQSEIKVDRRELPHDPRQLQNYTLGDLVIRYRDTITPLKRAAKVETIVLNAFLKHPICQRRMSDLSISDFNSYRDERLTEVKALSLKRMLSPIQNLFEVAKADWELPIRENLITKLKLNCLSSRRERRLKEGELESLQRAAGKTQNKMIWPIILFALETGLRRSEILSGRWGHLDIRNRVLAIPMAKNGHSRTIPLSNAALTVLAQEWQTKTSSELDRIFPLSANAFRLAWERLRARAGLNDLHFHDLRHEAISRFFELGLTYPEVALLSGHRDTRMLFRYAHAARSAICEKFDLGESKQGMTLLGGYRELE